MSSIQADIYIHAAPAAVYRRFTNITEWPSWYPGVLDARWRSGHAWDEGAEIALRVRNVLGMATDGAAIVRMSVPDSRLVWETMLASSSIVATARFEEEVGGCKLTIRKNYHGPLTMLLPLLRGRQEGQLRRGLAELKRKIEGQPRG
jgi:hypothetical protein